MRRNSLYFAAGVGSVLGVAAVIEITGGLPSQLAHLYYIPVVVGALMLPTKLRLAVATLAAAAVSPLPDLLHGPLGLELYYDDPAPWNLKSSGWIVRPIAFFAVSTLAAGIVRERVAKIEAKASADLLGERLIQEQTAKQITMATSKHRGKELNLLSRIDKMILGGASETDALREIARLTAAFTGSPVAGIVVPDEHGKWLQSFSGHPETSHLQPDEKLPFGEGVGSWAIMHGTVATSRNVFQDARYQRMTEVARRAGYVSAAAAPKK
jgi:hypothetical protein